MNKRGQFYLVAAIIIVSIIIGFIAISNYAKKQDTVFIEDVAEEISIEAQKVFEYDLLTGENKIDDYGIKYSEHIGNDVELYILTGNENSIQATKYLNGEKTDVSGNLEVNEEIIFTLYGTEYTFELSEEDNFHYLVFQEIKGESFVVTV